MDQEADLILDRAPAVARAFQVALDSVSPLWNEKKRISRRFFGHDPFDRLVPEKLLFEGMETLLRSRTAPSSPLVLFMNRGGHGDGAKAAAGLMPILKSHLNEPSFVHVSFNTPARGLGALVRSVLMKRGAEHGIDVHVVCHNRPAEGLRLSAADVEQLIGEADLVVSFSSAGADEPFLTADPLVARSHLAVLSFPDPESLVAELDGLDALIGREPGLDEIRFWVQAESSSDKSELEDLGTASLRADGDAREELWKLIEHARRRPYQVLVEPRSEDLPSGDSLICACRTLLQRRLSAFARVDKIVPVGARLVVSAAGKETLS